MNKQHQTWLLELTQLPTATGREDRVVAWVKQWVKVGHRAKHLRLDTDRFGNLTITRRDVRPSAKRPPIYFTAHLDHPAFVVQAIDGECAVRAVFRGGVDQRFFVGTRVRHHANGGRPRRGVITKLEYQSAESFGADDGNKVAHAWFDQPIDAQPGDVMTWDLPAAQIKGDRLHTPACDDLAGVAAALAALDALLDAPGLDVRVLLTRAEEIGFIGAIAAAKHRTIPRDALVVALENSKSYPESPIGAGPIVRVGDFTSTFDPDLTYRVGRIAQKLAADDKSFKYQRKLMPGGTCEASAYQCYGYRATCLCLALGNYHNMNADRGKIEREFISLSDYHGLVRLLVAVAKGLHDPAVAPSLRARLDELFAKKKDVLK